MASTSQIVAVHKISVTMQYLEDTSEGDGSVASWSDDNEKRRGETR
jgi:hypothetical protein